MKGDEIQVYLIVCLNNIKLFFEVEIIYSKLELLFIPIGIEILKVNFFASSNYFKQWRKIQIFHNLNKKMSPK